MKTGNGAANKEVNARNGKELPMETKNITLWGLRKYPEDGKTGIVIGLCDECIWGFASEALKSVRLEDGILVMTDGITEIRCDPKSVYPPEYSEKAFRDIFSGMDGAELDRILDSIRDTIAEVDKKYWANTKLRAPLKLGNGGDTADTEEKESSMEKIFS